MDTTMRWPTRAVAAVLGGAVAAVLGAGVAWGAVPPSDQVFPRVQTWTCDGGLGVFETMFSPPGQWPAVVWLSRDGGRQDAVMATLLGGETTLTFGTQEPMTFSFPVQGQRRGVVTNTCWVWAAGGVPGTDSYESISGTAVIAVVGGAGVHA